MLFKRLFNYLACILLCLLVFGLGCYAWIGASTKERLYDDAGALPPCKTALVLGTSPQLRNGNPNLYFTYRMDAAERLFKSGKVRFLILSGDNRVNDYNEPRSMQKALLRRGIPDSCLVLDNAGLRTFDSMVRCGEVFGQDSVIVVSQQFHNARACFISERSGLTCFGYNAQRVITQQQLKMKAREFFSRIKCVMDLYLLNTRPKHLGPKISIP